MERRNFERMPCEAKVKEIAGDHVAQAKSVDLSVLGMKYVRPVEAAKPPSREVTLELRLPGERRPVRVRGFITSEYETSGQRYTSVMFAYLRDEDAQRICRHLGDARA